MEQQIGIQDETYGRQDMESIVDGVINQQQRMDSLSRNTIEEPTDQIGDQHDAGAQDEKMVELEVEGVSQASKHGFPGCCSIAETEQQETEKKYLDAQHGFHHDSEKCSLWVLDCTFIIE